MKHGRHKTAVPGGMLRRIGLVSSLVGTMFLGTGVAHGQSAEVLATKLAELRSEVEELSEDLTTVKTDARNEVQALARQKSDLEVELDREQVRLQKLRSSLSTKHEKIAATSSDGQDLAPLFEAALASMRGHVQGSLPFRREERLAELDKIEEQRRTGVLTYPRALVRLWGFIEDEFRMTRENASFRQTITLDGEEKLAEVVRLGMTMLFFQTSDGQLGHTRKSGEDWAFVVAAEADEKGIRDLFDSFKKQIRVGFFRVPNALPAGTGAAK